MKCIKSIPFYSFPSTLWLSSIIKERKRKHRIWLNHFRFLALFSSFLSCNNTDSKKRKKMNIDKIKMRQKWIDRRKVLRKKRKRNERKIINNWQSEEKRVRKTNAIITIDLTTAKAAKKKANCCVTFWPLIYFTQRTHSIKTHTENDENIQRNGQNSREQMHCTVSKPHHNYHGKLTHIQYSNIIAAFCLYLVCIRFHCWYFCRPFAKKKMVSKQKSTDANTQILHRKMKDECLKELSVWMNKRIESVWMVSG